MKNKTFFAPSERTDPDIIREKNSLISSLGMFREIFDAINVIGAVLDKNRQVVYANNDFLKGFGFDSIEDLLGKRPGEAISCLNSSVTEAGCGTSKACSVCGAVNAILESQVKGEKCTREASITTEINGTHKGFILKVTSSPVTLANEVFYLLLIEDISNEKRREALERIFFHDILNLAGSLNGLLSILKIESDPEEIRSVVNISEETSRNLLDEIIVQRMVIAAEDGNLELNPEKINSLDLLNSAVSKIKYHTSAKERQIVIDGNSVLQELESDRTILQRILINLLKNALEATPEGEKVFAGCRDEDTKVSFWVKNNGVIPQDVQMQIFQRSFSTKGKGRGLGTYSIKLLTDNYLHGHVSFISNESDGTVFTLTV
jgi:K+-sensing histidine kinase KdpD